MINLIEVKRFNKDVKSPRKQYIDDAGYDLFLPQDISINPFETLVIPMGLGFKVPFGYTLMFVPKTGITAKGIIIQTAMTDSGYTGETHYIVTNCSLNKVFFEKDSSIASFIIVKYLNEPLKEVSEFKETERGSKNFIEE